MADFDLIIKFPHQKENQKWLYMRRDFVTSESPVFHRLIYEDPLNPKSEIELTDVNSMMVYHAFYCISTSGESLASERLAVLLRKFAKDYQMKTLFGLCEKFLLKNISASNVEVVHDLACHFSDTGIQFYCWLKFDISWREIFSKASFYQCSDSTIRRFVSRPIYKDMDEFFLWNALYTWGLTKMLRENSTEDPVLHRKILDDFLPHIRFLIMKREELDVIFNSNILTFDECRAIIFAYENKDVRILPPSICRSMHARTTQYLPQHVKHIYSYFCPKHTRLRYIKANDHFHVEFLPSHDCFLIGFVLPVISSSNEFPLVGHMEISKTDPTNNKKEQCMSRFVSVRTCTMKLPSPIFIEGNWRTNVNLFIQTDNLHWQIDPMASCNIGYLEKYACEEADFWRSFYFKDTCLYF